MKRKVLIKRDYETEHGDFSIESQGVWPCKRYRYISEVLGNSLHLPYKKRVVSEWHADKITAIICATEYLAWNHAEREKAWETELKLDRALVEAIQRGAEKQKQKQKEETMTFENGKIYQVKSPETGNIYHAFWSSDRERFIVLQLVAGGEVNTCELDKGCVVEGEE